MSRAFQIPMALRAKAVLELRRRRAARAAQELEEVVVIMPPMDPLPVAPAADVEAAGATALAASRQSHLAAALEQWRKKRERGAGHGAAGHHGD